MTMKTISLMLLAVLAGGCSGVSGTRSDPATGLAVKSNGLTYRSAQLIVDGVRFKSRDIAYGKDIVLQYSGVKGFIMDRERVFPGASVRVLAQDGTETFGNRDVFAAYTIVGTTPSLASVVLVTLTVGKPMMIGQEYLWEVRVWDKRGPGEIVSEMKFKVRGEARTAPAAGGIRK
jgi:hypothetical protein